MNMLSFAISVIAMMFSSVAFAAGEKVSCIDRNIGDSFVYAKTDLYGKKTSQHLKVVGVEGENLSVVTGEGQTMTLDKMFNPVKGSDGRVYSPKYYTRLECPFVLGEIRNYTDVKYNGKSSGAKIKGSFTVSVESELSTITVPAGTFKVVKIISKNNYTWENGGQSGAGYGEVASYYSPELGVTVKSVTLDKPSSGNPSKDQSELAQYSRDK